MLDDGRLRVQAILFASAARKGFGLQTLWGHGFIMARLTCGPQGLSCWSGPCYVYVSGNNLGLGAPSAPEKQGQAVPGILVRVRTIISPKSSSSIVGSCERI